MYIFGLKSFFFQKCVAYTGNNMRKQTPAPDKKEKDASFLFCLRLLCVTSLADPFLFSLLYDVMNHLTLLLSLSPIAFGGGSLPCVSGLHRGEHETVTDETRETQNL